METDEEGFREEALTIVDSSFCPYLNTEETPPKSEEKTENTVARALTNLILPSW